VQFIDAVLKLEVTPQITAEATCSWTCWWRTRKSTPVFPACREFLALDTEAAETKVTVADGGTVVIGGIIISTQRVDIHRFHWWAACRSSGTSSNARALQPSRMNYCSS